MDLRKRRSQEKLQNALAHHLQHKSIDEITIGELTRSAGVSRQTFYSNFDSKQSILLNRIETLFDKSWKRLESLTKSSAVGREEFVEFCLKSVLEECDKDRALMRAAFTGRAGIQALSMLKRFIIRLIQERVLFQFNHNFEAHELDAVSEFISGGVIGVIQGWLMSGSDKDIDVVAQQIGIFIPHGLDGYITRSS